MVRIGPETSLRRHAPLSEPNLQDKLQKGWPHVTDHWPCSVKAFGVLIGFSKSNPAITHCDSVLSIFAVFESEPHFGWSTASLMDCIHQRMKFWVLDVKYTLRWGDFSGHLSNHIIFSVCQVDSEITGLKYYIFCQICLLGPHITTPSNWKEMYICG